MIIKTPIEIYSPKESREKLQEIDYRLLEPAIFVKSCLTSHVAGMQLLIFRERDIQIFLNKLMGMDELATPDFVFDEASLHAVRELMNQIQQEATASMAEYLGNTMKSSECIITISEQNSGLVELMGTDGEEEVLVVSHKIKIGSIVESEFLQVISQEAEESLLQEIQAKEEQMKQDALEEQRIRAAGETQYFATSPTGVIEDVPSKNNLGLLMNVPLNVTVEIGRTKRKLKEVLGFESGTVLEFEKQANAPVDIIVNGQLIARGDVVVIDDNFGVRVTEIVNKTNLFGNGE
ncbi:MAG: flagellar motor switch protein FliN [Candidatus Ruminococcus intestinipullorum]|nr:flagellar motor switch protein FliN [Candidatus Ruminococcus intestinipullorum]